MPTLSGMGQSQVMDSEVDTNRIVVEVVSSFVTRETSADDFRMKLSLLWENEDSALLAEVLHIVAVHNPDDESSEDLRFELRALLQSRLADNREIESRPTKKSNQNSIGFSALSSVTYHLQA